MNRAPARPDDRLNAFTEDDVSVAGAASGPLRSLTFGAKDLYDVAGHVTHAGSPAWAATHGAASQTAPVIATLLAAGADLVAKTHTDELAWSLLGQNAHYGTPTNPRTPERVPGGSSAGSVVAVAGGLVDFAVGSDTGGSVRVPASNCGVYGLRSTHGAISLERVVPLAPSFDTVGWFAREPETLDRVGRALLGDKPVAPALTSALVASDALELADPAVAEAVRAATARVAGTFENVEEFSLAPEGLGSWADAWRTIQAREIWAAHGAWVEDENPEFGPGIRERFEWAKTLDSQAEQEARAVQSDARDRLLSILEGHATILLPAVPAIAPRLDASADELEQYRTRAMMLTCPAGLAGLPQISIPAGEIDGCPVGLGVIGPRGSDLALMRVAVEHAAL